MESNFFKVNKSNSDKSVDMALRNARRAICGAFEKETTVKADNLPKIIKGLQGRGYTVIGTSYNKPGTKFKKLWFVKQGLGSI